MSDVIHRNPAAADGDCHAAWKQPDAAPAPVDLAARARRASPTSGAPRYWRSLEELAATPEFEEMLHREFPALRRRVADRGLAPQLPPARRPRRSALAGLDRLHAPADREDRPLREAARGDRARAAALLRHRDAAGGPRARACWSRATRGGRPRSRATPTIRRASARPTPSRRPRCSASTTPTARRRCTQLGRVATWESFADALAAAMADQSAQARAPACASSPGRSPRRRGRRRCAQLARRRTRSALAPLGRRRRATPRAPARGRPSARRTRRALDFDRADVLVALDSDFLDPGAGRGAPRARLRGPPQGRRPRRATMNRLYVVESAPSPTGAMADHRLAAAAERARPRSRSALAARARRGGRRGRRRARRPGRALGRRPWRRTSPPHAAAALVVAGESQPAAVHALVARDQRGARQRRRDGRLHRAGRGRSRSTAGPRSPSWRARLAAGEVELLVVSGVNPVYDAPADLDFADALAKVEGAAHPPRALRRRDRRALPLARAGGALPRELGRRARPRRHR